MDLETLGLSDEGSALLGRTRAEGERILACLQSTARTGAPVAERPDRDPDPEEEEDRREDRDEEGHGGNVPASLTPQVQARFDARKTLSQA